MNESFIRIKGRIENKNLDELVAFLENEKDLYAKDVHGNYVSDPYLTFLLSLDYISQKLYNKDSDCGYWAIELSEYTNGETGYFDKLFESASLLIRYLIKEDQGDKGVLKDVLIDAAEWNVILKMDTHNNPKGKSKYSLLTPNDKKIIIKDEHCKSLAYTLFFDYFDFCNYKKDAGELTDNAIYTVHKEFINEKTARSFSYEMGNGTLVKRTDGIVLPESDEVKVLDEEEKLGRGHYLSFIRCLLDKTFIRKGASSFSDYLVDSHTKDYWDGGADPMKSFSYFNLGIPGFESWGTLMIESNNDALTVYNKFYRKGGDNEDSLLLSKIKNVISALKKIDDEYNDALNKQKIRQESIKSAKAAIMSRNMSHNLGSHVMSYLKQNLSSVRGMLKDKILYELVKNDKIVSTITENMEMPFLVGLGHFVSYLQERQDFIATIATDFIPYNSTVNFKDGIYDMLNPDKKFERHSKNKETVLQTDNILLGNIARSEGLGRPTSPTKVFVDNTNLAKNKTHEEGIEKLCDIVLKFRSFNGDPCEKDSESGNSLSQMREYDVSLPSGIVGRQAIFSIVENVIRNAAKHGKWRSQGNLELTFDIFSNKDDDLSRLPAHDNEDGCLSLNEVINKYYLSAKDRDDVYFVTLTDNCKFDLESLGKLRYALLDEYVDEKGTMNSGNKGLKEIRISSAWLRALTDEKDCLSPYPKYKKGTSREEYIKLLQKDSQWEVKDNENLLAPVVYARIAARRDITLNDNQEEEVGIVLDRHLQYIFCLAIPRKAAVISDVRFDISVKEKLKKKNWRVYTLKEFINERNKSFDFILCDDLTKSENDIYKEVRPIASSRVFCFSEINGITSQKIIEDSINEKEIELYLYKKIASYKDGEYINIDDGTVFGAIKAEPDNNFIIIEKEASDSEDHIKGNDPLLIEFAKKEKWAQGTYFRKGNIIFTDGRNCGEFIYRRHHETNSEFSTFMNKHVNFNGFVEGVSGGNSTDRLIRGGKFDDVWFYCHLHAMKQQIAIFDERIFTKITGLEENDFVRGNVDNNISNDFEKVKEYYIEFTNDQNVLDEIDAAESYSDLNCTLNDNPEMLYKEEVYSKSYLPYTYLQKGIYVFTLIEDVYNKNQEEKKYHLIGVRHVNNTPIIDKEKNSYNCLYTHIADFVFSSKGFRIDILEGGEDMRSKFNFMSIHQGLLDKLYELAGIKGSLNEFNKKVEITKEIYDIFVKKSENATFSGGFLPGMTIHSGRSKPGINEMPQKIPFIQYASLEHAVMDCKYSLVELLDFARYE